MSANYSISSKGAAEFNAKVGGLVGWKYALPHLDKLPLPPHMQLLTGNNVDYGSLDFAEVVRAVQGHLKIVADGKLGAGTWRAIRKEIQKLEPKLFEPGANVYKVAEMPLPMVSEGIVVKHEEDHLLDNYKQGCEGRDVIVAHWGGINARSCHNALTNRGLSSHLHVEAGLVGGKLVVYQAVDLVHTAHHCVPLNPRAVGFDICRSPQVKHAKYYKNAVILPNTTGRGEPQYIDIDGQYGALVMAMVRDVARIFNITVRPYPGHGVLPEDQQVGFIGHHHVRSTKWDIACWARHIWPNVK